jgi:hypothetical protein
VAGAHLMRRYIQFAGCAVACHDDWSDRAPCMPPPKTTRPTRESRRAAGPRSIMPLGCACPLGPRGHWLYCYCAAFTARTERLLARGRRVWRHRPRRRGNCECSNFGGPALQQTHSLRRDLQPTPRQRSPLSKPLGPPRCVKRRFITPSAPARHPTAVTRRVPRSTSCPAAAEPPARRLIGGPSFGSQSGTAKKRRAWLWTPFAAAHAAGARIPVRLARRAA